MTSLRNARRRRWAARGASVPLAAFLVLIGAFTPLPVAEAHITVLPATPTERFAAAKMQRFMDQSELRTPDRTVRLSFRLPTVCGDAMACAKVDGPVFIRRGGVDRITVYHEVAHAAIDGRLLPNERDYWTKWVVHLGFLDDPEGGWFRPDPVTGDDPGSPGELFADAWADCSQKRHRAFTVATAKGVITVAAGWVTGYGYTTQYEERPETCGWLRWLTRQKGWHF